MLKNVYRKYIQKIEQKSQKVRIRKQWIGEILEIYNLNRKAPMNQVKLTKEEKVQIQNYWKNQLGKKIPLIWHKKYYAYSGKLDVRFFPEILYTTKLEPLLNSDNAAKVLSDKNLTEIIFSKVLSNNKNIVVPKTICGCSQGFYYDDSRHPISYVSLIKKLMKISGEFIIKPSIGASSGAGVRLLVLENGIDVRSNQKIDKIILLYGKNFILQEKITQHPQYAAIHPQSTNTIRIFTYRIEDEIKVAPAIMRFGVGDTHLDNAHAGGVYAGISDEGVLHKYATKCNSNYRYEVHPDTGIRFEGYKLPYFKDMVDTVKQLHTCIPNLGFINWDVTINDKDQIVLIESNMYCGGIWVFQNPWGESVFRDDTEYMIQKLKAR